MLRFLFARFVHPGALQLTILSFFNISQNMIVTKTNKLLILFNFFFLINFFKWKFAFYTFFLIINKQNWSYISFGCNNNRAFEVFKGGLSGRMTIFKCFRVIFSFKKKTIQFPLSFNLYFQQKRTPKLSICHLPTKRSVWVFDITNRTKSFSNFQSYHQVVMYLLSSLAKSCTLFWKYS